MSEETTEAALYRKAEMLSNEARSLSLKAANLQRDAVEIQRLVVQLATRNTPNNHGEDHPMSSDNKNNNPDQERARYAQTQEREDHLRRLREAQAIEDVFATSTLRFKQSPEEILRFVGSITFDADGSRSGGKPLSETLHDFAALNPMSLAASVPEIHDQGKSSVRSKADLTSVKDKVAYIEAHGELAFARLPATRVDAPTADPEDYASYLKLPLRERAKLGRPEGPGMDHCIAAQGKRAGAL